jgi:hypothetical protein
MSSSWRVRDEKARYEKGEREALDAFAAPILAKTQDAMRKAVAAQREAVTNFWSLPFADIKRFGSQAAGAYDDIGLSTTEHTGDETAVKLTVRVLDEFLASLAARTGYTLSSDGVLRFTSYFQVQILNDSAVTPSNLQAAFDRLLSLGIFESQNELGFDPSLKTYVEPRPEPQAAPEPTIDDLLSLGTTQEDLRRARELADQLGSLEAAPVCKRWLDSLYENFNGFVPTDSDMRTISSWFARNNKSWLDERNYDECRRWMCRTYKWPNDLLTNEDRLMIEIEDTTTTNDFTKKRELIRRVRDYRES